MDHPITFHNSLSKEKEIFSPISDPVRMYNCGPTVYSHVHIGNLRTYILGDLVRRVLEYNGHTVTEVMNITDVGHLVGDGDNGDDKMTNALIKAGKPLTLESMRELGEFYATEFVKDLEALNILQPQHLPYASDHIAEDISMITKLEKNGLIYTTSDGVYFDTGKTPEYGKLGGVPEGNETQARIAENSEKRSFRDFALWKFNAERGWDSPWGKGFPGWHIECSGMATKYLGESFDIHTGGIDLLSTHHNNEIAQSEGATGKPFVNYWIHGEHLKVDGTKMSKSLGNVHTLRDITDRGYHPLSFRYWTMMGHYRTQINFTWEALSATQNALQRLYTLFREFGTESGAIHAESQQHFHEHINDDLDIPRALSVLWDVVKNENISPADRRATVLDFDRVLGLGFAEVKEITIPGEIQELVDQRESARKEGDWGKADQLRTTLQEKGFDVQDTESGPRVQEYLA